VRLLVCGGNHPRPQAPRHGHDALLALPELPRPVLALALALGSHKLNCELGHHRRRVGVAAQLGQRAVPCATDGRVEQQPGSQHAQGLFLVLHIVAIVRVVVRGDEEPPNERPRYHVVLPRVGLHDGRPKQGRCGPSEMSFHLVSVTGHPALRCLRQHFRAQPSAAYAPGGQHDPPNRTTSF
jgi:hypothetical protein